MTQPTSIDWTKIKALTFDIYGTLVDWDAGVIRAARTTALGPYLPPDDEFLNAVEKHHARIEREHPRMRKSDINAEGLRAYAADLKVIEDGKLTEDEIEQAARQFGGSIGGFEAFDDTVSEWCSITVISITAYQTIICRRSTPSSACPSTSRSSYL